MEQNFESRPPLSRFAFRDRSRPASQAPVFDVIEAQHRLIHRLFDAIAWYAEGDDEHLDLFDQARRELLAHFRAEEEVPYAFLASGEGEIVAHSLEDHRDLEAAVERLAGTPIGEDWESQFDALRAGLHKHTKAERDGLFLRAKASIPVPVQAALGRTFEEAHDRHLRSLGALTS